MAASRNNYSPGSGKMIKANGTILDVALLLEALQTACQSLDTSINHDLTSGALNVIEYEHHEIHAGDSYWISGVASLATTASLILVIVTPNTTKWAHMMFDCYHEVEGTLSITEGVTVDANGTEITTQNRNRNVTNPSGVKFYHTPTNPTGGTVIWTYKRGSGNKSGGENRDVREVVLKQNTKYLFTITNSSNQTGLFNYFMNWYEHTNNA